MPNTCFELALVAAGKKVGHFRIALALGQTHLTEESVVTTTAKVSILITVLLTLPMGFNACSPGFSADTAVLSSSAASNPGDSNGDGTPTVDSVCEEDLRAQYQKTYFPLLSANCNNCHGNAQGSRDLTTSFSAFNARGANLINLQCKTPHGGNSINLTPQINALEQPWATALTTYNACQAAAPVTPSTSVNGTPDLTMSGKALAPFATSVAKNTVWYPITWDLSKDLISSSLIKAPAVFSIEVRALLSGGVPVGFEFRNPSIKMLAANSAKTTVRGLRIKINGLPYNGFTIYQNIAGSTSTTSLSNLAPGFANGFVVVSMPGPTTQFSFTFDEVN